MDFFNDDLWSLLIYFGIAQGVFTIILFVLKKEYKSKEQLFLLGLVLTFLWIQLEFLSVRTKFDVEFSIFYGTRFGSWFLLGPLIFLYISSIKTEPFHFRWTQATHFMPFLFFALVTPLLLSDSLSFRQVHYGMLTPFDNFEDELSTLQYILSLIFMAQFIHFFFYLLMSNKKLRQYKTELKRNHSSFNESDLKWIQLTVYSLIGILVLASAFLAQLFFSEVYRRHLDYIYALPMGCLMYIVSFRLAGVKWLPTLSEEPDSSKYEKSSLKPEQASEYALVLQKYMENEKPYLRNGLKLNDLAQELAIPIHHLSQVINTQYNLNFYDFINKYRVEEAKKLIKDSKESTLLEIAFSSGFNNKTSFNNAFKKFSELTPFTYRKKVLSE